MESTQTRQVSQTQRPSGAAPREATAVTSKPRRSRFAGVSAGAVFLIGYLLSAAVPSGGDTTTKTITDFYRSSSNRAVALATFFVLLAGSLLMVWFFTELRSRLPHSTLAAAGYSSAMIAAGLVTAGAAILMAPAAVQMNAGGFVGVPVAHAFGQAGLGVMIGGIYAFAAALFTLSLAARRAAVLTGWIATAGLIVAVVMLGSYIWLPGVLLPIWVLAAGITGLRQQTPA
jgi:hypothetical protein